MRQHHLSFHRNGWQVEIHSTFLPWKKMGPFWFIPVLVAKRRVTRRWYDLLPLSFVRVIARAAPTCTLWKYSEQEEVFRLAGAGGVALPVFYCL